MTRFGILFTLSFAVTSLFAGEAIQLPEPQKTGGKPFMEVLAARKTNRRTRGVKPTEQQLADLLWAANGINREDGKRTAPSAMNRQAVELAVLTEDGFFTYDPKANQLIPVSCDDAVSEQRRNASAVVVMYYKTDAQSRDNILSDVGFVGQNLYLYCASQDWPTVFTGALDRKVYADALGREESEILYAQRIGIPEGAD